MKRFNSLEAIVEFETKRGAESVEDEFMDQVDVDEFMPNFEKELGRFMADNNVVSMMVFEAGEMEDEEYALAYFEESDAYKMVYMSCRGCDMRFIVF